MKISSVLGQTWKPALGCTEPASIAYAAALAASRAQGEVKSVSLSCDPRVFKNCFAVGLPNSEGKTGILWAMAIGSFLPDPSLELECFKKANAEILKSAGRLLEQNAVQVDTVAKDRLYIDCRVVRSGGTGRAVIEGHHTNVVMVEKDGVAEDVSKAALAHEFSGQQAVDLENLSFSEMIKLVGSMSDEDRRRIREGCELNLAIAKQGMSSFKHRHQHFDRNDSVGRICQTVFSGVYARMSGSSQVVMSAAGSGNKGITCSLPLALYGEEIKADPKKVEEALALSILLTDLTTRYLGTLSAICGCINASGIGLAAGLVYLQGGGEEEISHAVSNMVGNISGIICDGAKIGCALKAMTAVDAAFRAAALAMNGICIPVTDGIVGANGKLSLENLGRIANHGMIGLDDEILQIMKGKLTS